MPRIKQMVEQDDGWSKWQCPVMQGYRMACCDCGLVHNVEFQVVKVIKENPDGTWWWKVVDGDKYRVRMRAQRNKRSTAAVRRKRKGT